jgi:pimeloyl-ACP methyl ester carboxylesterase
MAMAQVSDRKFYYEMHGPDISGDKTPLLLINGMGGSCRGWIPLQVPEFPKTRPTLIICGRHDRLPPPPKLHRELAGGIAHLRLVVLQYGAHHVVAESAESFHKGVQQFLESQDQEEA